MAIRDMVTRHSDYKDTMDLVCTPPYVTRAFYKYVAPEVAHVAKGLSFLDPAAGRGHMALVAEEMGHSKIEALDLFSHPDPVYYGTWAQGLDFLTDDTRADVIVTNPPYKLLPEFLEAGFEKAQQGLGMLVRVQALEGQDRYWKVFEKRPPTQLAFFSDRIPFVVGGKVVRKAPKMFFHVWLWWNTDLLRRGRNVPRAPIWIPPTAQVELEKDTDYD